MSRRPRYNAEHRKLREQIKRSVDTGTVRCWRCGELIVPDHTRKGDGWHLGHDDELGGDSDYAGPEHDTCSWQSGLAKGMGTLAGTENNQPASRDW